MLRPALLFILLCVGCAQTPEGEPVPSYKPNAMNVLLGGSFDRAGDGPALGANYEHRLKQTLGVGGFGDIAFADETSTVLGGAVFVHPADRWTLLAGPGVEFVDGDADVVARVGGWYAIPVKEYAIAPTAWLDLGDGVSFFLGLSFCFFL